MIGSQATQGFLCQDGALIKDLASLLSIRKVAMEHWRAVWTEKKKLPGSYVLNRWISSVGGLIGIRVCGWRMALSVECDIYFTCVY